MKIWILISLFFLESCAYNHKIFTVKPSKSNVLPASNKNLKINGAYYRIHDRENYNYKNEHVGTTSFLNFFMLYNNELAISTGLFRENKKLDSNLDSIIVYIKEIIDKTFRNDASSLTNAQFGGYSISGNKITIQTIRVYRWNNFFVANYIGEIFNETTIHITKYELIDSKKGGQTAKSINDYYHFVPIIKPDSVIYNRWNSKKWYWRD